MKYLAIFLFIIISLNSCSDSGTGSQSSDDSPIVEGFYHITENDEFLGFIGEKVNNNIIGVDLDFFDSWPNPFNKNWCIDLKVKKEQRISIRIVSALPSAKLKSELQKYYDIAYNNSGIDRLIADTILTIGLHRIIVEPNTINTLPDGLYRATVKGELEARMLYTGMLKYSGK